MDEVALEPFELPGDGIANGHDACGSRAGRKKELYGLLEYSTDLFDAADDRAGFIERFQVLLEGIVASAGEQRLGELPLLLKDERERLMQRVQRIPRPITLGSYAYTI